MRPVEEGLPPAARRFHLPGPVKASIVALLLLIPTLSGCAITHAVRVTDRQVVDLPAMIGGLVGVPVVFVGERHDEPAHHALQLQVLKGLKERGASLAIAMEMFEGFSQRALDAWSAGKVPIHAFMEVYRHNWKNLPFSLYEEIFEFARDHRIPIIALNAPREIVQKVSRQGLASLNDDDRRQLPPGADAPVDSAYLDFIASSYGAHAGDGPRFRRICEAQMLRNRVMASRIRDYHGQHPGRVIVVIAGGGHVRGRGGIPAELGPIPYRIVIPPMPGLTEESIRPGDSDYLLEDTFSPLDLIL